MARFGGQQGRAKRSSRAGRIRRLKKAEEGAVVGTPDPKGPALGPLPLPEEQLVTNPKLGSYDAIAEALD